MASQLESVQNAFNFNATPFLTLVGFAITAIATAVMYFLPVRYYLLEEGSLDFVNTIILQCDQSSQAKVGGADPRKKFIGKNSKTP